MELNKDYSIKHYNSDPTIDFNKAQADIYNSVVEKYTGEKITPESVKKRIERDKFDPNGMMYVFSKDNQPLAYIRYYIYPSGRLYIGYPWCLPECPTEVQDTLFNTLKDYLKKKFPDRLVAHMGFADNRIQPFHEFAKRKKFEKDDWEDEFLIDIDKFSQHDLGEFSYKEFTRADIDALVQVAEKDFSCIGQEEEYNEERLRTYFQNEVLKDTNAIILLKNNSVIGGAGVLRHWRPGLTTIQFQALDKEYERSRILLFIALTKLLKEKRLLDEKIAYALRKDEKELTTQFENYNAKKGNGTSRYKVDL